jgi:hypothetical protein
VDKFYEFLVRKTRGQEGNSYSPSPAKNDHTFDKTSSGNVVVEFDIFDKINSQKSYCR